MLTISGMDYFVGLAEKLFLKMKFLLNSEETVQKMPV